MKLVTLHGDLLAENAEALVNTVNCVGVMGKGVALQFKRAFPQNFKEYVKRCKSGDVRPGKMLVFDNSTLERRQVLINFPTKLHWRQASKLEYISEGLDDLVRVVRELKLTSIAIPPLGCGNGGLRWDMVKPIIEEKLSALGDGVEVRLFEPDSAAARTPTLNCCRKPSINRLRAAIFKICERYKQEFDDTLSHLVIQKLMYFFELGNGKGALRFSKNTYGPYSQILKWEIDNMEGHYLQGFKDHSNADLYPIPSERPGVDAFFELPQNADLRARFERVGELIVGFETWFNMELLASVHWACAQENARNLEEVIAKVHAWTPRKKKLFDERMIEIAYNRLREQAWI